MADSTASSKPNHHLLVRKDDGASDSAPCEDAIDVDTKSYNIISNDNGVDKLADGVSMPMSRTGETTPAGAEPTAVPLQQYEDLVSKFHHLEDMLARVDKVVQRELVKPFDPDGNNPFDTSDDEDELEDPFLMEVWLNEYVRNQNTSLRENNYLLHMLRRNWNSRRRQRRKREIAERSAARDEAMATEKDESQAVITARLAEMLASGTPATCLRTTWGAFQSLQQRSTMLYEWREERRRESLVNPFELLTGEVESTFIGSRERKPRPQSMPPTAGVKAQGEAPLPERIIFHSAELLNILNSIHDGGDFDPGALSAGILRPFKMLVYYESQIRDYAAKLEAEVARYDETTEDSISANLSDDSQNDSDASDTESQNSISTRSSGSTRKRNASTRLLHIRCLLDFIENEIRSKEEYLRSSHCEKVTFSDLWYLFQPGVEVIDQDNKQVYRVMRVMMPKHNSISPWEYFRNFNKDDGKGDLEKSAKIHCVYIDFDGEKLGPVSKTFEIPQFEQEKPIRVLPIYPLGMVREAGYREQLVERGKMLWDVIQVKPMYYNGHTVDTREEADSQVMIDFGEAFIHAQEHEKDWKPRVGFIPTSLEEPDVDNERTYHCTICCYGQSIYDDSYVEVKQTEDFIKSQLDRNRGERPSLMIYPQTIGEFLDTKSSPSTEELVLMSYRAFGFILRSRKWAQLDLAYMKYENKASRTNVLSAFDRLILPDGHKDMVQSLVTQHFREKRAKEKNADLKRPDAKTDLIRGKGQGLIILLHGAPGVGKTTTAEGIAETFKKPLFQITSGDLGTTASEVQEELEKNFTLASRWDCILLLDEAEVFLASRDRKDFQRNGLVAVFLRVLEYYAGVLFLTTNRVGDFDEAFASRIHMSLHYPKLDLAKTLEIFKVNLQLINDKFKLQQRNIFLDEDSILQFAKKHFTDNDTDEEQDLLWNGRQIRNACQTALAMAEFEALDGTLSDELEPALTVQLKLKHFHIIEVAYNDFATYLGDTYGVTQTERMAEGKVRAEEPTSNTPTKKTGSTAKRGGRSVQR